jgi:coenzyme PQQ synthesis protein D (PqqD)
MSTLISDAVVMATKEQFSCPLGGDTIILNLKAGLYFSLDNVGAFVWRLVQEPKSVKELRQAILTAYEVEPEVCERDLAALLHELADRNLVEIRNPVAT